MLGAVDQKSEVSEIDDSSVWACRDSCECGKVSTVGAVDHLSSVALPESCTMENDGQIEEFKFEEAESDAGDE